MALDLRTQGGRLGAGGVPTGTASFQASGTGPGAVAFEIVQQDGNQSEICQRFDGVWEQGIFGLTDVSSAGDRAWYLRDLRTATKYGGAPPEWKQRRVIVDADGQFRIQGCDANNAAVNDCLKLVHRTMDGTAVAGIGVGVTFTVGATGDAAFTAATINAVADSVDPAAFGSRLDFYVSLAGATVQSLTLRGDGVVAVHGALGVGNTVAKTTLATPGTVVKMMEVFDAAGVSLGAVAVYSKGAFS